MFERNKLVPPRPPTADLLARIDALRAKAATKAEAKAATRPGVGEFHQLSKRIDPRTDRPQPAARWDGPNPYQRARDGDDE